MKIVIENKSKAKDRDVIEIIKDNYEYINFKDGLNKKLSTREIEINVTVKKNIVTFVAVDL